jgi:arylsulfatase
MSTTTRLAWLFVLPLLALSTPVSFAAPLAARKPNIIFILSDDLGYGDLARNGNPILQTPHLDAFYDQAAHFEDFHVSPTCSPTRSALMSGKHEFKNGVTHTILERERLSLKTNPILPQILKSAGYSTGIFGKWHLGDEDPYQPDRRGFDEVFIHGGGGIGQTYPGSCGDAPGNTYTDPVIKHNGTFVKTHGFCTDVFFAQALEWLDTQRKQNHPFFCYIPTNAAHVPLSCPPQYEQMYAGKVPPDVAKFFGMITNIDDNVGKLMAKLKEWNIDQQTLVIYMNDNGGFGPATRIWNANMRGSKNTAYNGGTRAMSLWRWPGAVTLGARDQLTAHLDVYPTLAELAGVPVTSKIDGFSLVPLLQDPHAPWHDERLLFTHTGRWGGNKPGADPQKYADAPGHCSVRWQQYLLVRDKNAWQLHDLKSDPGEKTDVAADHPGVVSRLDKAYDAWWAEILPCLENEQAYKIAPAINPFHEQYWKQFHGPGPNNVPPPPGFQF